MYETASDRSDHLWVFPARGCGCLVRCSQRKTLSAHANRLISQEKKHIDTADSVVMFA